MKDQNFSIGRVCYTYVRMPSLFLHSEYLDSGDIFLTIKMVLYLIPDRKKIQGV